MKYRFRFRAIAFAVFSFLFVISCVPILSQADNESQAIDLSADAADAGQPLVHFWSNTVGAGRANEGLRASWQEQLHLAQEYDGFRYVRFHGLFHDDMFVYHQRPDGTPYFNFQYIDDLFDRMLANNVRPFVELSFTPEALASNPHHTVFWWKTNSSPPADYNKWADLIRAFAQHCIQRYGKSEVESWYFEVWNEPDLDGFWSGTQAQYFDLYKITALTLKSVDPALRVGGPATSNYHVDPEALRKVEATGGDPLKLPWHPTWINDFLDYCYKNHLPVDFVSTHPYPQDFPFGEGKGMNHLRRSADSTRDDLRLIRQIVDKSQYPHAEIHLTEWNSSPSPRDHIHDSLPAAAFIAKCNLESIGLVDSLSYWTFTDVFEEGGAGDTIFHGGFGLINYQGIVKPSFHAYRMMNALGDQLVKQLPGAVITREQKSGRMIALAYNYPSEMKIALPPTESLEDADKITNTGSARSLSIQLSGLPPNAPFLIETLDKDHGNATAAWEAMGAPPTPTREQTEALRKAAWATRKELTHADSTGKLIVKRSIQPWSLILIKEL